MISGVLVFSREVKEVANDGELPGPGRVWETQGVGALLQQTTAVEEEERDREDEECWKEVAHGGEGGGGR